MKEKEITGYSGIRGLFVVSMVLMMVAITVVPAAALTTLPYKHCNISVANDNGTRFYDFYEDNYYMKFDGGGLNALHITTDPSLPYGQTTSVTGNNGFCEGTFYVSDTGGRGYDDDIILMFATNSSDDDFTLTINASGYQWTPTTNKLPPSNNDITYVPAALYDTFGPANFSYGPQIYKMSSVVNYPLFYGQDMSQTTDPFKMKMMFIDLNVGALGINSSLSSGGMAEVDYTLENFTGFGAFNAYAWCLSSNQGQGISWTNRVLDAGSSGYTVSL